MQCSFRGSGVVPAALGDYLQSGGQCRVISVFNLDYTVFSVHGVISALLYFAYSFAWQDIGQILALYFFAFGNCNDVVAVFVGYVSKVYGSSCDNSIFQRFHGGRVKVRAGACTTCYRCLYFNRSFGHRIFRCHFDGYCRHGHRFFFRSFCHLFACAGFRLFVSYGGNSRAFFSSLCRYGYGCGSGCFFRRGFVLGSFHVGFLVSFYCHFFYIFKADGFRHFHIQSGLCTIGGACGNGHFAFHAFHVGSCEFQVIFTGFFHGQHVHALCIGSSCQVVSGIYLGTGQCTAGSCHCAHNVIFLFRFQRIYYFFILFVIVTTGDECYSTKGHGKHQQTSKKQILLFHNFVN